MATEIIEEIHEGDIGTVLVATLKNNNAIVNISTATTKHIFLQKPSGSVLTKDGTFTTDGTDGKLQYTTIIGDLNETGVWQIQLLIINPSGTWRSNVEEFSVFPNLA